MEQDAKRAGVAPAAGSGQLRSSPCPAQVLELAEEAGTETNSTKNARWQNLDPLTLMPALLPLRLRRSLSTQTTGHCAHAAPRGVDRSGPVPSGLGWPRATGEPLASVADMMVASCRPSRPSSRWWLGGVRAMQTDARQAIGAHAPPKHWRSRLAGHGPATKDAMPLDALGRRPSDGGITPSPGLLASRPVDWTMNGGMFCPALRQAISRPDSSSRQHRRDSLDCRLPRDATMSVT